MAFLRKNILRSESIKPTPQTSQARQVTKPVVKRTDEVNHDQTEFRNKHVS